MPKQETSEPASTVCVSFDHVGKTTPTKTGRTGKFRTMNKTHVNAALTSYLRSMSMIEDNEEVTNFNKAPDSLDVKIEKVST